MQLLLILKKLYKYLKNLSIDLNTYSKKRKEISYKKGDSYIIRAK